VNIRSILLFLAVAVGADLRADEKSAAPTPFRPVVAVEEDVSSYTPANNGAGPMRCSGSTCLVRIGEDEERSIDDVLARKDGCVRNR
jgi:hypothetical protein